MHAVLGVDRLPLLHCPWGFGGDDLQAGERILHRTWSLVYWSPSFPPPPPPPPPLSLAYLPSPSLARTAPGHCLLVCSLSLDRSLLFVPRSTRSGVTTLTTLSSRQQVRHLPAAFLVAGRLLHIPRSHPGGPRLRSALPREREDGYAHICFCECVFLTKNSIATAHLARTGLANPCSHYPNLHRRGHDAARATGRRRDCS